MNELSPKQRELMEYIQGYITANGHGPTIRQIEAGTSYRSTSAVKYALDRLETDGWAAYTRQDGVRLSRTLRVLRPVNREDRLVVEFVGEDARIVRQVWTDNPGPMLLILAKETYRQEGEIRRGVS